jgi:hypothetical protein
MAAQDSKGAEMAFRKYNRSVGLAYAFKFEKSSVPLRSSASSFECAIFTGLIAKRRSFSGSDLPPERSGGGLTLV